MTKKNNKKPETKTPETKTPETKTPETKTPETKTPETKTPETKTPETKTPETKTPETKTPETKTPEIKDEPKVKDKMYKVRKDLGFEKRNYFIGNKNVLLVAGEGINEETYNLFNDYCKKTFFE